MKEFLEAFIHRIRSPIFGYFSLSFFIFNWKGLLFIIVSSESPVVRIRYFEEITSSETIFWYPLISAVFMGIIYPWINLIFIKVGSFPAKIRNNIYAETEHSRLMKKLDYEKLRNKIFAEQERQIIEKSKRDEEIDSISDPSRRESVKAKILDLRKKHFQSNDIELADAAKIALESIGIVSDKIATTGESTGVRIWLSRDVSEKTFDLLHEEIVSLHGQPVALDVRDFITDKVLYDRNRPKSLSE